MIVPAIIYYELKRELLRARKSFGISRLDNFISATPGRYLPLSDEAADVKDIDVDVILAAQALSFGPAPADVIVATTNAKHLSRFITAKDWHEIVP